MNRNDGITIDPLFVGPTRPSTIWGVTWQAFVINAIITIETFIWTRNLFWLLLFIPLHGISYLICLKDPRTFELLMQWGPTKGFSLVQNFFYWKAATHSPLLLQIGRKSSSRSRNIYKKELAK